MVFLFDQPNNLLMNGLQTCLIPKGHVTYLIYAQGDKCLLRKLTIVCIFLESHFVQFLQVFSIKYVHLHAA